MISTTAWEWFYYVRSIVELALLIWAMVLVVRARTQMKRMKDVIDDQSAEIDTLRKKVGMDPTAQGIG